MAKKSAKKDDADEVKEILTDEEEKNAVRERIRKELCASFGENVMIKGSEIVERPKMVIPISPRLDAITGGGIPEGSWVIMSGTFKGGKTMTALHFAANCQKPEYGARNIYYLNVEGRLKKRDLLGMAHLDPDKFDVIESTPEKILSSQDFLTAAERILMTDNKAVMIIDSISSLCEDREIVGGIGTETRGGAAKLVGQFTKQMAGVVPVKNHILIAILQVKDNTSGRGLSWFESGGKAIQFQSDIKLRVEKYEYLKKSEGEDPYGQLVHWQCHWSALSSPNKKTTSYIRYGDGVDELQELLDDAGDVGLIRVAGAWCYVDFLERHLEELGLDKWEPEEMKKKGFDTKFNGSLKLRQAFIDNPEWVRWLKQDMKEFQ